VLFVLAATAVAALLRFAALGHESIWLDEAYSLDIARTGYRDLLSGRVYDPGNPAGYFLLLRAWLDLTGSASIETARALSALAGTLAVPAVWLLARTLAVPRRATWLACGLVALSPPLVYLSQEARAFALLATVATLAAAAAARIERDSRPLAWAGFAAAGVAMVHLHYYGFFVLAVLGIDLLVWACRGGRREVLRLALAAAAVALGFAPYLPTFVRQLGAGAARSKETWWQHLALLPSFSVVGRTLVWKEAGALPVAACAALVVLAVFVPLAWLLARARPWPRLAAVLALGLPALVGLVALKVPMVHSHYLSVVFPALLLLIACALDAGLKGRVGLGLWVPAVALAVLTPAALARLYLVRHKTDWRAVAAAVERRGGDLPVYFYEDLGAGPFAYYLPGATRHELEGPCGAHGDGWARAGYLDRFRAEGDGFWLVYYPASYGSLAEEGAVRELLSRECAVEQVTDFPPLRLFLCRPTDRAARAAVAEGRHAHE
jgi:4-amino-4-deoxy-L-arabinose transferase-like glycosyltransferase